MRTLTRCALTAVLALFASTAVAQAQSTTFFTAFLTGSNEVPPNDSPAFGVAALVYDLSTNMFEIGFGFGGLTTPAMMAHIHQGAPSVNGPVIFNLTDVLPMATSGVAMPKTGSFTEAQEAALYAGNLYVNIHTETYPGGEIRGQLLYQSGVQIVPEPGTVLLLGSGLLALGGMAVRRRGRLAG